MTMIKLAIDSYRLDGKLTFFGKSMVNTIGVVELENKLLRLKINKNAMIISAAQLQRIKALGTSRDLDPLELTFCESEIVSVEEYVNAMIVNSVVSPDWIVLWPDGQYAWTAKAMKRGSVSDIFSGK